MFWVVFGREKERKKRVQTRKKEQIKPLLYGDHVMENHGEQ